MTWVCPEGHSSEASDYCDVCGLRIGTAPSAGETPDATPSRPGASPDVTFVPPDDDDADTSTTAPREPCPDCGTPRSGDDRFCELCGHDFREPPAVRASWEVVVRCDRAQFERFPSQGLVFPADAPELRFTLKGDRVRIGRGRPGEAPPEIDLAGSSADPGISRPHAVLERCADGSYAVRDLGSTNGTTVGDGRTTAVGTDTAVTLTDGDVIRIGAWTAITVHSC